MKAEYDDAMTLALYVALENLRTARMQATQVRDQLFSQGHRWVARACDEKVAEIDELINSVRAVIDCDKSEAGDHDCGACGARLDGGRCTTPGCRHAVE